MPPIDLNGYRGHDIQGLILQHTTKHFPEGRTRLKRIGRFRDNKFDGFLSKFILNTLAHFGLPKLTCVEDLSSTPEETLFEARLQEYLKSEFTTALVAKLYCD